MEKIEHTVGRQARNEELSADFEPDDRDERECDDYGALKKQHWRGTAHHGK